MSADDQDGPPAEKSPFPYLKRGTGSQKYTEKITYQRRKSSTGSNLRPSASSVSSGFPSTSTSVNVDIRRPTSVPPLQMSPPATGSVPDSGRGSAAPQEQIYANPSNRSVESGYGGYNRSFIETSDRSSNSALEGPTLVNDYENSEVTEPQIQEVHTDDEVFLPNQPIPNASPALSSFIRHENDISREMAAETAMSTPTRELREHMERMTRNLNNRSQSSLTTNPEQIAYNSSDDGPLNSTPISFGQEQPPKIQLPSESTIRSQESGRAPNRETAILGHATESTTSEASSISQSYKIPSEKSASIAPSFVPESISGSSLGSLNRELNEIAGGNRPLREAFPEFPTAPSQTPPVRPSESTQYRGRPMEPAEDNLRRTAITNNLHRRREIVTPATTSSDEFQPTPIRKLLPRAVDPVAQDIRRQLRDGVSHMDLGHHNLRMGFEQVKRLKKELDNKALVLEKERTHLERCREEFELERQRTLETLRKDRQIFDKEKREFYKAQSERDKENREQIVSDKSSIAGYRVQLNKKDQTIQKQQEEITAKEASRVRLEKLLEQREINHKREIKKLKDETTELHKRLSISEAENTKRRNGLQPRTPSRASPLTQIQPQVQPQVYPQIQHQIHPEEEPTENNYIIPNYNNGIVEQRAPKQVHFNLRRNTFHNDSYLLKDYHKFVRHASSQHPMGLCNHFINEDNGERTYVYDLCHIDGKKCSAKVYKYQTNDAKWMFGPIEAYLFHKYPLVVKIRCIDLEIKVFEQTTEIHRDYNEISCLNRETSTVSEVRRRRDLTGYYALNFSAKTGQLLSTYGSSDQSVDEDMIALRRGVMEDKREFVEFNTGNQGYEIHWISEKVPSRDIKSYKVISVGIGGTKIQIGLETEIIDITCWPENDYLVIRHKKMGRDIPCCDLGKPSRDRERSGIYEATGKLEPFVSKN